MPDEKQFIQMEADADYTSIQPIYSNHISLSMGTHDIFYLDFRTIVPKFDKGSQLIEGDTRVKIKLKEEDLAPHTRMAIPRDLVFAFKQVLDSMVINNEPETTERSE